MKINIKAKLETRTFKNGDLEVLVLYLSEQTQKIVFLSSAEMEILKLHLKEDNESDFPDLG